MYKISQVAEILDVPTVHIHEKLIFLKKDLKECIHKKNAITYIDEKGLVILKKAFECEMAEKAHIFDEQEVEEIEEIVNATELGDQSKLSKIEDAYDIKVIELKEKIGHSKSDVSKLDIEIKQLDEAILHYQKILKDDIDRRIVEEKKITLTSPKVPLDIVVEPEKIMEVSKEGSKKGFFKTFRNK